MIVAWKRLMTGAWTRLSSMDQVEGLKDRAGSERNRLHFGEYFRASPFSLYAPLPGCILGWFENWNGILCSQEPPLLSQRVCGTFLGPTRLGGSEPNPGCH